MQDFSIPTYFWLSVHFLLAILGGLHVLLYKRDPRAALSWLAVCIFVPVGGPIAYLLFGINRVRSRAHGLRHHFMGFEYESSGVRQANSTPTKVVIRDIGRRLNGYEVSDGNLVTTLFNGDQAYPVMLAAIASAKERIELATYIFKCDETGLAFANALGEARARGVEVRVLLDGLGECYSFKKIIPVLKRFNVKTARFLAPRIFPPSFYINLRNHRKLLIIDDRIAFAGGMNIDSGHTTVNQKARSINDIHFELRGPLVTRLSEVFQNDWVFATRSSESTRTIKPAAISGNSGCRVIIDGPNEDMDMLALVIQAAISSASDSVDIMTPYFLPNRDLISALQSAALRGVKVRIVLPEKNNLIYMHWAHRNLLVELLRWGIEVFYQAPPFCHTKLLCIDDDYTLMGSANLDPRSLRLNFEIGVEVFSASLRGELRAHFDQCILTSRSVSLEELENRSISERLRDSSAALLSPYL